MQIRRADLSDSRLLAEFNHQLIRDEGHRNPMSVSELDERMKRWLDGDYQAFVFSHDAVPIGYVLARRETEHVYVRQFFVRAEFRRRGLGKTAFRWLQEHEWSDCERIRLDVLVGNERGIAFWRAMGFTDYCLTMECD